MYDGRHWWYFKCEGGDGRWHIDKAGLNIHQAVIDLSVQHFGNYKRSKNNKLTDAACDGLIKRLNTRQFRDPLVKDCCVAFYDPAFLLKLNSKPNLIGCKNGVFDIDEGLFRDGRPTDYLTFTTNVNYLVEDIERRPEYPAINRFMEDPKDSFSTFSASFFVCVLNCSQGFQKPSLLYVDRCFWRVLSCSQGFQETFSALCIVFCQHQYRL